MYSVPNSIPQFHFNSIVGGFENVWISQASGEKWISIDLGDTRIIKAVKFRGGFYMGEECRPGNALNLFESFSKFDHSIRLQKLAGKVVGYKQNINNKYIKIMYVAYILITITDSNKTWVKML